ncbi:hypothetical protein E5S67_02728 [Microcoleus sp. IPMA8]|uniref:Uncharacterized protein n=1 Tax=Microcoleus asticus IPMA8 TaxID=2563858 RepID=A0ABX2CXG0_9CYAN|nr:hypothetical protein [Microcoleus asticus IPMA8]
MIGDGTYTIFDWRFSIGDWRFSLGNDRSLSGLEVSGSCIFWETPIAQFPVKKWSSETLNKRSRPVICVDRELRTKTSETGFF